ncbi:BlaI/MecI/CopY family transcriptional regulator [Parasediminibacterium paludis]|uniref:BlaI/MecI/CopY family transcriptional regulator n=1 Tax=Parasediminibacterium paludis TaxID=908966 RepID=A0ABV8PW63_9BACT
MALHEVHGRNHYYFPIVSKADYSKNGIANIVANYFEGSFTNVVSFMVDTKSL